MRLIGNIIWIITGGLASAVSYLALGVLWCVTVIGIPFGIQSIKMAGLVLAPFGKTVDLNFGSHPIANILWFIFGGFALWASYLVVGLLLCVTVIGIPFGLQLFKFAKLNAFPFGAKVY